MKMNTYIFTFNGCVKVKARIWEEGLEIANDLVADSCRSYDGVSIENLELFGIESEGDEKHGNQ